MYVECRSFKQLAVEERGECSAVKIDIYTCSSDVCGDEFYINKTKEVDRTTCDLKTDANTLSLSSSEGS